MPNLLDFAAKALVRKGEIFWALNRPEDALATCDEVVRRFGEDDTSGLHETVAVTLLNKGNRAPQSVTTGGSTSDQ